MNLLPALGVIFFLIQGQVLGREVKLQNVSRHARSSTRDVVKFKLFTKDNPNGVYISKNDTPDSLRNMFTANSTLKMICHGFNSSENERGTTALVRAYLEMENVNVIGVGWKELASNFMVLLDFANEKGFSASTVMTVGNEVRGMIDYLVDIGVVSLDQLHLIGHSLGAHVMGVAGSKVSKGKVARITGLEPAISSQSWPLENQLDTSDGDFVDMVIITIWGDRPTGHANFFLSGGNERHNTCSTTCWHSRAWEIYEESIKRPHAFPAIKSDSLDDFKKHKNESSSTYMGEAAEPKTRGTYYLEVNKEKPFGRG